MSLPDNSVRLLRVAQLGSALLIGMGQYSSCLQMLSAHKA